jgi:hypothetical protein
MDVADEETQLRITEENLRTERLYKDFLARNPNGSMAQFWKTMSTPLPKATPTQPSSRPESNFYRNALGIQIRPTPLGSAWSKLAAKRRQLES